MQFAPKSAEELAEEGLLPDGEYDFTVQSADEGESKAGNEMIVLGLQVFDGMGGHRTVRDYLVSTDGGLRKIRGFAVATGILDEYERGKFDATRLVGLSGVVKVKKDANPGFEPKNAVAWYIDPTKRQASAAVTAPIRRASSGNTGAVRQQQPAMAGRHDYDDEIPF